MGVLPRITATAFLLLLWVSWLQPPWSLLLVLAARVLPWGVEVPAWGNSARGRSASLRRPVRAAQAGAPRQLEAPTSEDLVEALGRELWAAGDALLDASGMLVGVGAQCDLGSCGLGLHNAAEAMLSGDWGDACGELEGAAAMSGEYVPEECYEGLISLFAYEEPVPKSEWPSAQQSLDGLSEAISDAADRILGNPSLPERVDASEHLMTAAAILQRAACLFEPGGFSMPDDPREHFASWEPPPQPVFDGRGGPRTEAIAALGELGCGLGLLEEVDAELALAAEAKDRDLARSKALRSLVRRLHPDQNPGKEAEVLPVFRYVQKLRASKGE